MVMFASTGKKACLLSLFLSQAKIVLYRGRYLNEASGVPDTPNITSHIVAEVPFCKDISTYHSQISSASMKHRICPATLREYQFNATICLPNRANKT